jgi:glycosyltransferase involved in cell wall biosynthesis
MIRRADLIMAVSEFTRERIERMFPAALGKCIVIGNGVDLDEFCPPTEKAEVQDKPFVLIVGGLREQKGGDLVLEAAKRLHSIGSNLQFKITGRSLAHLESEARRLPNVSLCGYVPATEMPDLYRRATALYFPSRYEGFGLPIVEALACLTPVVCSDQPALLEAARGAALTTSAADPTRATDLLRRLEIDPAFREAQRERALRVRRELGWDPVVNRVTEALNPN